MGYRPTPTLTGFCDRCKGFTFTATKLDFDGFCISCALQEFGSRYIEGINKAKRAGVSKGRRKMLARKLKNGNESEFQNALQNAIQVSR